MSKLRYRSPGEREMVAYVQDLGFVVTGRNKRNHLQIQHTKVGMMVIPGDYGNHRVRTQTQLQIKRKLEMALG